MAIEQYAVTEKQKHWLVSYTVGKLTVEYKIPKDICADREELQKYVADMLK